jgi:hypothetical protein
MVHASAYGLWLIILIDEQEKMLLIDAHVHIYDCFDLEVFFNSAYRNFQSEAERLGAGNDFAGILLLAETSRDQWFDHLTDYAAGKELPHSKKTGKWSFRNTVDDGCLEARDCHGQRLYVMAGRQIVTAENLEVLALLTVKHFEDGFPLEQVLGTVRESGALPVIPWGFGKWTGKRGRILKDKIGQADCNEFFLGDNSGRAAGIPRPSHFVLGLARGIRLLGGTDPLPLSSQEEICGSFGVAVPRDLDKDSPRESTRKALQSQDTEVKPYGKRIAMVPFLVNQYRLLVEGRVRNKPQWAVLSRS